MDSRGEMMVVDGVDIYVFCSLPPTVQITSEGREHSDLTYNLQTDCGLTIVHQVALLPSYNSTNYQ